MKQLMTSMSSSFHSLRNLSSISDEQVELLRKLGINNLGDLLAHQSFRYARFVLAAKDQLLRKDEALPYLDEPVRKKNLAEILDLPPDALKDVGRESAGVLKELGMITIADVARFAAFAEAEEIVTRSSNDDSDPFAPACVLPTCKKFTRNSKSYVSFFKQEEIRDLSILPSDSGISLISNLFRFKSSEPKVIHLGYSVSYLQEWIFHGVHLGEPQGSVNLFMGQDTQVSVLDWRRAIRAFRLEDTRSTERLASTLFHQRALDEVARATAEEHQQGATSAFGANAATAGSFVAAGAVVGGVGGGISGALAGLVLGNVANAAGGAPTLAGAAVGTAVGSLAGAAAGSLIFSGTTTLGFVETDAEGDRKIFASSAQNIQQRTVQNSSSLRSFWSNIISQSVEEEQQQIRTDRVTNHNRIHALNALYFEVLNEYQVNMRVNDFAAILFVPYKPILFTKDILRRYWWLIRTLLNDRSLVLALDQYFQTLASDPSSDAELEELPDVGAIESRTIIVEVNLDGSAMQDFFEDSIKATGILAFLGPLGLIAGVAALMVENLLNDTKRKNVRVAVVTTNGEILLNRESSSDSDPNFIGRYTTSTKVSINDITSIKISNVNPEFAVGTPNKIFDFQIPNVSFDVNELVFENISAKVTIQNKGSFSDSLPNLGALEANQTILGSSLKVGSNRSKTIPWNIANRLRSQFEGVNEARVGLEAELASEEVTAGKIANLLGFLNANKFGFTRLILQNTESEQLISVLEGLQVGGVDLNEFAGTTPLGFCGNHVVLPLKKCIVASEKHDPLSLDVSKLKFQLMQLDEIERAKPQEVIVYIKATRDFLDQFLQSSTGQVKSVRDRELVNRVQSLKTQFDGLIAATRGISSGNRAALMLLRSLLERATVALQAIMAFINAPIQTSDADMNRLFGFYASVRNTLKPRMGELLTTTEVSLPSPAVFMEPILSNAKGAELYDMRRNSHYEILPAPGIVAADPNVLRARDLTLTPNVPPATLTIQNAPELPLPTSLAAALGEAGKLNLGTLIQSNASSLTSMLSNLSSMATELAKASATLTGDAQKQALASAADVAKQVGDIVSKSLVTPSSEISAPPPVATPSPQTQQQKAEIDRRAREIDAGPGTPPQKKEQKKTIGAATTPDDKRNYQFSLNFLDMDGIPYTDTAFTYTLKVSIFETGEVIPINGGDPIQISDDPLFRNTFALTKGRKIKLSFIADIGGVLVPGVIDIPLTESPDVTVTCTMKSETQEVTAGSVKEAVDTTVSLNSFGTNLGVLFDLFLNAGAKFPFKVAEATVGGSLKVVPDLKLAYTSGTTTTTGGTTTTATTKVFKVTTPINGWNISVT